MRKKAAVRGRGGERELVNKRPAHVAAAALVSVALSSGPAIAQAAIPFSSVIVDSNNPRNPHCKALRDINGDGQLRHRGGLRPRRWHVLVRVSRAGPSTRSGPPVAGPRTCRPPTSTGMATSTWSFLMPPVSNGTGTHALPAIRARLRSGPNSTSARPGRITTMSRLGDINKDGKVDVVTRPQTRWCDERLAAELTDLLDARRRQHPRWRRNRSRRYRPRRRPRHRPQRLLARERERRWDVLDSNSTIATNWPRRRGCPRRGRRSEREERHRPGAVRVGERPPVVVQRLASAQRAVDRARGGRDRLVHAHLQGRRHGQGRRPRSRDRRDAPIERPGRGQRLRATMAVAAPGPSRS